MCDSPPPSFVLLGVDKSYLSQDLSYRQERVELCETRVSRGGWDTSVGITDRLQ